MAEKNKIVDDYYSNISEKKENKKEKGSTESKIKKKIVIKKQNNSEEVKDKVQKKPLLKVVKKSEKTEESEKKIESKKTPKKQIVQKITVIKKEDLPKKPIRTKKSETKKVEKNEKKAEAKKIEVIKKEDRVVKERPSKKVSEQKVSPAFEGRVTDNSNKKFSKFKKDDKKSQNSSGDENFKGQKNKNSKNSRTRGKFNNFTENEEVTFTRSKASKNIKKEEKNVENIKQNLVSKKGEKVVIGDFIAVKELSEKLGVPFPRLIAEFMKNGMMVNINSKIDFETAAIVSEAFEIKLERDISDGASAEDIFSGDISNFLHEDDSSKLINRPPVISIMGHVDHGKTSLLDHIRKAKVAAGEAGGITQSIGAYQVELDSGVITFLDTPGHEAFTVMRARGAKSTDIAILVVAADEGVKPQTIESINHAKEADIPVIVAINKMDKEGANPDHVKGQLSEHGLVAEEWGGSTPMVPVSAHSGFGIDDLLEMILLVSEMKELKANPERAGVATVIESHLDNNLGPVATVLVNTGTINSGDNIVCSDSYGKVKILRNYANQKVKFSLPGSPALIVGLDKVVEGGDILQVVPSADIARTKAIEFKTILDRQKNSSKTGLDLLMSKIKAGNLKQLKIILKADTNGSLEAMKAALLKLSTPETTVSIIHSGVGAISESDILMGKGSEAILVGFHVGVLPNAKTVLDGSGVEFISSQIIYHITERIEKIITGMLDPKEVEVVLGKAKVGGIFFTEKKFMIAGLVVGPDNKIEAGAKIRVFRKKKYVGAGNLAGLKQGTLEVKVIEGPTECGIKFEGKISLEIGDELEFYKIEIQK